MPSGKNAMSDLAAAIAQHPLRLIVPLAGLGLMLIEWLYARLALHDARSHDLNETASSLAIAVGNRLLGPLTAGLTAAPLFFAHEHRLFDIPARSLAWFAALLVLVDFIDYWFHRASHRIRWLWATHAVHHSTTKFNLTAAIRLGWTRPLSGAALFFLPLCLIGFHPLAVIAALGINLLYQFLLHTEHAPSFGLLDRVLNSPRHHSAHHAANASCLDRNFGGIFIVWDRLFGTFAEAPTDEPLRFGLADPLPAQDPLTVNFHEWRRLLAAAREARGIRDRLRVLFGPP
jgi:sterol desaturase/sphingolipid hydroxylase (fatty acid hydroxylase superfamily)